MSYLFGLIGHPVSQSMSPPLHKAALSYFGMKGDYKLFDVESSVLSEKLDELKSDGLLGFNITIPHKIAVYNLCHELTAEAKMVGAANTVLIGPDDKMTGHNTDFMGLHDALKAVLGARRDVACVLGAGGAAKAALRVLEKLGFKTVIVFARDKAKAARTLGIELGIDLDTELCTDNNQTSFSMKITLQCMEENYSDDCTQVLKNCTLIINCLPLGQTISEIPAWLKILLSNVIGRDAYIYDMVYSKSQADTLLVCFARAAGLKASDGMSMLLYQALYAFEFWTGKAPPYHILENAFNSATKR